MYYKFRPNFHDVMRIFIRPRDNNLVVTELEEGVKVQH